MPEDNENVPTETASEEGVVSPEVETPAEEKPEEPQPEEQPLTREEMKRLIAEESEKARELGRREMQGIKDKEVAQALKRAKYAEDISANMEAGYREIDPQAAELARLRGLEKYHLGDQQRQQLEQQVAASKQVFYESMAQSITEMGVDTDDKRIDWAADAPDPATAQRRILSSVGKIQREEAKAEKGRIEQQLKDAEAKIRKDLGLDSVETATSAGVGGLPFQLTNEAIGKLSYEEYKKYEKQIDEAQQKGLIK